MIQVKILKMDRELPTPKYAHYGDAGMDVYSAEDYILRSGEKKIFNTGLKFEIPEGYELQVRPKSGLAAKHGITVLNSPGTLDFQYRGILGVILINHGNEDFEVKRGERIAQIVFNKFETAELTEVDELSETIRGEGGFGSTGRK
jgi:dUTP pyrophosphatase